MAREFQLSIVAPDREVVDQPVQSIVAPGVEGYFGVLAGHVPLIAALNTGLLEYLDANNQRHYVALGGGFAEVTGTKVTILADTADRSQEIDVKKEEEILEQARRTLRGETSDMTLEQATIELDRAINRIKLARMPK